jgi:hypothetical protein
MIRRWLSRGAALFIAVLAGVIMGLGLATLIVAFTGAAHLLLGSH